MDFVRQPVIVAYVPAENRTLYLRCTSWQEVRRLLPDHSTLEGMLVHEVPLIDLKQWNSAMVFQASLGILRTNTVAAKFDDGAVLWLTRPSLKTLLRSLKPPTLEQLSALFPYLKDAELQRLQTYDFGRHRKPFTTHYEN